MNTSSLSAVLRQPGLLDEASYAVVKCVVASTGLAWSVLGMVSNAITISTYMMIGVEDSSIANFLGLAWADMFLSLMTCGHVISEIFLITEKFLNFKFPIFDPKLFARYTFTAGTSFSVVSSLVTVYIAVSRSACVVRPLHFKNTFTKKKSAIVLTLFYMVSITVYIPLFANMVPVKRFNPSLNASRIALWFTPFREIYKDNVYLLTTVITPILSQIIVIICVACMTWYLLKSAQFRQKSEQSNHQTISLKLSGKDLRVVQQVVLISAVFILCNTPTILTSIFAVTKPEFDAAKRYSRMYVTSYQLCRVCVQINSSVNLFVYLSYNSKFREHCLCGFWKCLKTV